MGQNETEEQNTKCCGMQIPESVRNHAIVEAATSAGKWLLAKLAALLAMEWFRLSGLRDDIGFLRDELKSMRAVVTKLGGGPPADAAAGGGCGNSGGRDEEDPVGGDGGHDDLDVLVREWRDDVRRLADDVQACLDDYARRVGHGDGGGDGGSGAAAFFRRNARLVATLWPRHRISGRARKLRARVNDVSERRRRYSIA